MYYEIYVGSKSVRVCTGLVETYKFLKLLHMDVLYHQTTPFMHIRNLKTMDCEVPLFMSYVMYEKFDQLYIKSVKVVKKCVSI